jgi:hypothetical protein
LLLVPVIGIWAFFYIACTSGTEGPNKYGAAPLRHGIPAIVGAILLPLPALICLWFAFSLFFYLAIFR